MINHLVIWYNPNKDIYYYRFVTSDYVNYKIGYKNQYGHVVILVIDNVYREQYVIKKYLSIRKMVLTRLIAFLQKLNK